MTYKPPLTSEEKRLKHNESQKRYRDKNKEMLADKKKEWKANNIDWVREKAKDYNVSFRHRTKVIRRDRRERGIY